MGQEAAGYLLIGKCAWRRVLTDWEGQLGEVEGCEGELINELGISRKSELKFGVPPLSWGGDAPIILQGVDLMKP